MPNDRDQDGASPLHDTSRYHVPNLERALVIIEHLARESRGAGISELAAALDLPKNSVFRILMTLHAHGWVDREEAGKTYRLGRKLLALGYAAVGEVNLVEKALERMRELRDETKETVLLGTMVGDEGVVLEQAPSPLPLKIMVEVGTRFRLHTAAPAKAMMAHMPEEQREALVRRLAYPRYTERTIGSAEEMRKALVEARRVGYALDVAEHLEGIHCIAAPVLDRAGAPVAAIWVTGPSARLPKTAFARVARAVVACAQQISQALGWVPSMQQQEQKQ